VAALSKARVCAYSLDGIAGSNPTGGHGYLSAVSVVCCQVEVSASGRSLVQRSRTESVVSVITNNKEGLHLQVIERFKAQLLLFILHHQHLRFEFVLHIVFRRLIKKRCMVLRINRNFILNPLKPSGYFMYRQV
jgi:hypothetical protein